MFSPGNLLYFNPFLFPDGGTPKPKYFLVLAEVGDDVLLASLPTSKDHVPSDLPLTAGCLELPKRMINVYIFLANVPVTDNGFSFRVNTFIYGANIKTYDSGAFLSQMQDSETEITLIGRLSDPLFKDIINCLKNSDAVRNKYKKLI